MIGSDETKNPHSRALYWMFNTTYIGEIHFSYFFNVLRTCTPTPVHILLYMHSYSWIFTPIFALLLLHSYTWYSDTCTLISALLLLYSYSCTPISVLLLLFSYSCTPISVLRLLYSYSCTHIPIFLFFCFYSCNSIIFQMSLTN